MELKTKKVCNYTFTVVLTDAEARYLVEQHAERGSYHDPINHSFCHDPHCVSCKIVRSVREALK